MTTEPDDALLWARERCAELLEQEQLFSAANAIRSGANDAAIRLQVRAEAYRAGHAARDAEVETLRLALVACGKLLAERALVEALNDATAAKGGDDD
jgi:hypothetical protein